MNNKGLRRLEGLIGCLEDELGVCTSASYRN
jgi:hypothetical protein